ncbi:Alpha-1,4-N-acetylgalactosamine transferase PglH [Flavobacterium sp. 9R]|uniref:glycosyltransferase n=1 Tax=Flavobacterium sp. 9R TaxID=2653143 RepID=UPI0012F281A3|nr:glycosyltransferase [Flavobacterium sp. 9R]VXC14958.1 Alpha-1,4-N-acetylgalactosamine transferase PglH [Flavobacterium sp. 9R]
MRILQLIDSLEAGGAERMAVNYANALASTLEFSSLVATRKEGSLLEQMDSKVAYLFLNKKGKLDFVALWRLRSFVLLHSITHMHAHSTSFFIAFLLKLCCPSLKLIWHYHYGNDKGISNKRLLIFKVIIPFFNGVIAVNQNLKVWIEDKLKYKEVIYLPNFASSNKAENKTILEGVEDKRILFLANLRPDKNHFLLLEVACMLKISHPDWTFHLVGKDFDDAYSLAIKNKIRAFQLENQVFLYGTREDINCILDQSDIGILTSASEGLPVALLEYGMQPLAVVVTAVGELPNIINNGLNGWLVPPNDAVSFSKALISLISNTSIRKSMALALQQTVSEGYSSKGVLQKYLQWLESL